MKCHEVEPRIRDLIVGREPDAPALEHVRHCGVCGRRFQEELGLEAELKSLAAYFQDTGPSPAVRAELRRRFRAEKALVGTGRNEKNRTERAPYWLLAAAVLILTVAAGGLFYATTRNDPWELVPSEAESAGRSGQTALRPIRSGSAASPSEQMYSEFIPISNCRSMDCLDRAHMVRIDLPRASLADFGISKSRIRSQGDRIRADVLVGDDGVARAIRFVY